MFTMMMRPKGWLAAGVAIAGLALAPVFLRVPAAYAQANTLCTESSAGCCTACSSGSCCIKALDGNQSGALGQAFDVLVGDSILVQGSGWPSGDSVQVYWDTPLAPIGTFSGSSFNNDVGSSTCQTTGLSNFCAPFFSSVNGPCTSYVIAADGTSSVGTEVDGILGGVVIYSLLGPGDSSILINGTSPASGDATCEGASGAGFADDCANTQSGKGGVCPVSPHSIFVQSGGSGGGGAGADVVDNEVGVASVTVAVASGHTLHLGTTTGGPVSVTLPAGPDPASLNPCSINSCQSLGSPLGPTSLSSEFASSATSLTINGDLTMNNAELYVNGDLTVNGAVKGSSGPGTGAIIATGQIVVTGQAQLITEQIYSFVSGGDTYLCGTGTCPSPTPSPTGTPTPTATPTPTSSPTSSSVTTVTATPVVTPTPIGTLTIKPLSIDFGTKKVGKSKSKTIKIKNAKTNLGAAQINSIGLQSDGAPTEFAITGGTCAPGGSIALGRSCTIQVRFGPTAVATAIPDAVIIKDNGIGSPQIVPLSGAGK